MDKANMIIRMLDGGFSKDEIMELLKDAKPTETQEDVTDKNDPVQKNAQPTNLSQEALQMEEDEKKATQQEDVFKSMFDNLNASVEAFNKKIKSMNASIDEMKGEDLKQRTDNDIIASIVTPKGLEIK